MYSLAYGIATINGEPATTGGTVSVFAVAKTSMVNGNPAYTVFRFVAPLTNESGKPNPTAQKLQAVQLAEDVFFEATEITFSAYDDDGQGQGMVTLFRPFIISLAGGEEAVDHTFMHAVAAGNITREVESRYTPTGDQVTNVSLATNRGKGDAKVATFFRTTAWGKLAGLWSQWLAKGKPILVQGPLHVKTWQHKESGEYRPDAEISAWGFAFLPSSKGETPEEGNGGTKPAPVANGKPASTAKPPAAPKNAPNLPPAQSNAFDDDDLAF